jgi:6-phosphofructokinase 1
MKRLGILTAGGDCPGLNAVIRAVTKSALHLSAPIQIIGIQDGYEGLLDGHMRLLGDADVSGILNRGGTILGTSNRHNPFKYISVTGSAPQNRSKDILDTIAREHLDGLVVLGGDGTLRCALELGKMGVPVIGIPKTIDNDLGGTDTTFGFDSALAVATEAVDRLHSTAESHHRVLICEMMGRHAGWIALRAGIAGGADVILIPEIPYDLAKVCDALCDRVKRGKNFSIIAVAEGAQPVGGGKVFAGEKDATYDKFHQRLGGISQVIAKEIETAAALETRVVILGHLQRGGSPSPFDRWLATRLGVHAIELALQGKWGNMVALTGTQISHVPIEEAVRTLHRVDPEGDEIRTARMVGTSFGN